MKYLFLIPAILLASCASQPTQTQYVGKLNIYQPSILVLEEGVEIETKEGAYKPQTEEVWHSDKRFRELERELMTR